MLGGGLLLAPIKHWMRCSQTQSCCIFWPRVKTLNWKHLNFFTQLRKDFFFGCLICSQRWTWQTWNWLKYLHELGLYLLIWCEVGQLEMANMWVQYVKWLFFDTFFHQSSNCFFNLSPFLCIWTIRTRPIYYPILCNDLLSFKSFNIT